MTKPISFLCFSVRYRVRAQVCHKSDTADSVNLHLNNSCPTANYKFLLSSIILCKIIFSVQFINFCGIVSLKDNVYFSIFRVDNLKVKRKTKRNNLKVKHLSSKEMILSCNTGTGNWNFPIKKDFFCQFKVLN